jgi:hypothetical protein
MSLRYRLHRLTGQLERRCYAVDCLSNSGIALGPFNTGGEDLGIAVWTAPYEGPSSVARQFLAGPGVKVFAVNDAGQFVGHHFKAGVERAAVGSVVADASQPPSLSYWQRASAAYGINARGDYVGFRRKKGTAVPYLCSGNGEIIDLEGTNETSSGCYAAAVNDHGTIVGTLLGSSRVLVWAQSGTLVSSKVVDFGQPLKITNSGHILCSYGIIDGATDFWIPTAPRCIDFTAKDINNWGYAVGSGRPLNRDEKSAACLWGPESTCWNLNDLIDDQSVHLAQATAINDSGWIAADKYLLEPVDEI